MTGLGSADARTEGSTRKRRSRSPSVMVSPWRSSRFCTRSPLTNVPFLLARSTTDQRPPAASMRAWLRERLLCARLKV